MIIFLIEMLEYQTLVALQYLQYNMSHGKILLVMPWVEIMMPKPLFQNIVILRRPGVATFAYIIKIAIMFVKTIFTKTK